MTQPTRIAILAALILACALGTAGYVWRSAYQPAVQPVTTRDVTVQWTDGPAPTVPGLYFRSTVNDDSFGHVAFVPLDALDGPRYRTPISCDRLYVRAGVGACLLVEHKQPTAPYQAFIFDRRMTLSKPIALTGMASRTRVSSDGRWAAITVFETGHSYADGLFSTRTTIIDTAAAATVTDLEKFEIRRDGKPFKAVDFNFWGVTFTPDSRQFYATLSTRGAILLIRGDLAARTADVVREGIECPSLSPDGSRIAFKKRITGLMGLGWRLAILDVSTMQETELGIEDRSIDDQVDWLDDTHVVYHHTDETGASIWALRTDNQENPRLLLRGAYSPSVVR
jgi:WD40-like Beta Propeller Repeat